MKHSRPLVVSGDTISGLFLLEDIVIVLLITGKAGAGKTTYSQRLLKELVDDGINAVLIDGDEYRKLTGNEDYTDAGRVANLMNAASEAQRHEVNGCVVIMAFIMPKKEWRDKMRELFTESKVIYMAGGKLWKNTTYERPDFYE